MPLDQGTVNVLDFGGSANKVKQASNRAPPTSKGAQKMPTPDGKTGPNGAPFQPNPNVTQTATTSSWSKGDYTTASLPSTIGDVIMGPTPAPTTKAPATYTPPIPHTALTSVAAKSSAFNSHDIFMETINKMALEESKKGSLPKADQVAFFETQWRRIYTKNHPGKAFDAPYRDMTEADLKELHNTLYSTGYNRGYIDEYMSRLQPLSSYDTSDAPTLDPSISQRAFNIAVNLWNQVDGTIYYDPSDPFTKRVIEHNRGPNTASAIIADLVSKGFTQEMAEKATTAAYDEYRYQQAVMIEDTTALAADVAAEEKKKREDALAHATEMFTDGSTPEDVTKYLKSQRFDDKTIDEMMNAAQKKAKKNRSFGDKLIGAFDSVVGFWGKYVKTLYGGIGKGVGGGIDAGVSGLFGSFSFSTILILLVVGFLALYIVIEYVLPAIL